MTMTKSATTSRAGGVRRAPRRGRNHALLVIADIFIKHVNPEAVAAVVGKQEIMDSVHSWGLGGTYGGNPVACAAALAVLDVFEEDNMLAKSVALGEKLKARFERWHNDFSIVGEIRGLCAMLGLEFVKGENKELAAYCLGKGLLILVCGSYGNVVRVLAPFVITDEQLEKGLSIVEEGLKEISK